MLLLDVEIQGEVRFENDLIVDGKIEGKISSSGSLTIGEPAKIKAEINCGSVIVHGKVQGNITLSNHQWAGIMFLINDGKFAGFDEATQELIASVAKETEAWEREEINRVEGELLSEMEADGMVVTRLTQEQSQAFQDKMSAVWEEYSDRLGQDLIDAVVNAE